MNPRWANRKNERKKVEPRKGKRVIKKERSEKEGNYKSKYEVEHHNLQALDLGLSLQSLSYETFVGRRLDHKHNCNWSSHSLKRNKLKVGEGERKQEEKNMISGLKNLGYEKERENKETRKHLTVIGVVISG